MKGKRPRYLKSKTFLAQCPFERPLLYLVISTVILNAFIHYNRESIMYMNWYKRFTSKVFYLSKIASFYASYKFGKRPELSRFGIENVSIFETEITELGRVKLNRLLGP